jgi:hypothetical protein
LRGISETGVKGKGGIIGWDKKGCGNLMGEELMHKNWKYNKN